MQWVSERDAADATLSHHALVLEADDLIEPAYVEFWKRILADGCAHATRSGWQSLTVEICERQSEADDQGFMHAKFRDAQGEPCGSSPNISCAAKLSPAWRSPAMTAWPSGGGSLSSSSTTTPS
jgi:hypothetical protein